MIITFSNNDRIAYTAILLYITKLENTCRHFIYDRLESLDKNNEKIHYLCNDNEFEFVYKDRTISASISYRYDSGSPMPVACDSKLLLYKELTLNDNTENDVVDGNNQKSTLLEEFVLEAKKNYEKISKLKCKDGEIIIYSLDNGWWDEIATIEPRSIDSIILDEKLKNQVTECINKFNNEELKKRLKQVGVRNKLNIVLEGLPGTGKSSLTTAIATMLKKNIATIDFNQSDLSDVKLIKSMRRFPDNSIIVLEDFDTLFADRQKTDTNKISFSCILNLLDGTYTKNDMITIITTNYLKNIDSAVLRPMRTDYIFSFSFCSKYQCMKMYELLFPEKTDFEDLYKTIKNKKFTTSTLQKWFVNCIIHSKDLMKTSNELDELIQICSNQSVSMYT